MKAEATESFGYNEDLIVSSDIVGMRYGSLFDSTQTMVLKVAEDTYEVQVVSWYDNENASRLFLLEQYVQKWYYII